jgi:hypothetical protein
MIDETKEKETGGLGENLAAVGQIIVGQIETVGGILTGNPDARAEGEFNTEVGSLHQEVNKNLTAIENKEKISREKMNESNEDKSPE